MIALKKPAFLSLTPAAKAGAFLLSMVVLTACFWSGFVTLSNWNDLWLLGDYYRSSAAQQDAYYDASRLRELTDLKLALAWDGPLTEYERRQMDTLEAGLAPGKTNFRYRVHDQSGALLLDNLDGALLEEVTPTQYDSSFVFSRGSELRERDYYQYDQEGNGPRMMVYTGEGYVTLTPETTSQEYTKYGWYYNGGDWNYDSSLDERVLRVWVTVNYGIASPLVVSDNYTAGMAAFARGQRFLPIVALLAMATLAGSIGLLVLLLRSAGRQEDGTLAVGWQERIPYDLYLLIVGALMLTLAAAIESIALHTYGEAVNPPMVVGLGVLTLGVAALGLGLLLTTAVRLKTHTLWRTSLIGRLCRAAAYIVGELFRGLPVTWRLVVGFLLYLLGSLLTAITVVLIPLYQGFVLWHLCRWFRQWRQIEEGTGRIVGGDPDFKLNTRGLYADLRRHAEQLNDLGRAVSSAVEQQLKNERFRAELITNVSHDLKTPLTSIINYVGLLKALPAENPQAAEYIDVLDRKSQRLKKLTEDLVEASKASTGSLSVTLERLGMAQLLLQALGEYEERFSAGGLEAVFTPPVEELYVWADGRHLWRVIDNLFSNCAKYALAGTRIYLDLRRWEGRIHLSIKNISRQPLNIPPEQLMERFIRGEESRTTEGSGLGLSIARSLTELQQGSFRLEIDGDLFKAILSFPEALALAGDSAAEPSEPPQNRAV